MKKIILLLLAIPTFWSCQKTAGTSEQAYDKETTIYYYLRTDKTDLVTAEVYTRHTADTTLPMLKNVYFQDIPMVKHTDNRKLVRYKINESLPKKETIDFRVEIADYAPIERRVALKPIKNFRIVEGAMSKTKGFKLEWEGEAVAAENETLIILITDANGQAMSLNRIGETAESGLIIDGVQLQYFTEGLASIYLVRKTIVNPPKTGYITENIEIEYYTDEIQLPIIP